MPVSELLSLSDVAFVHDLSKYREDLEVYFIQHWTADKFFAMRKQSVITYYNLRFLIILSDGLNLQTLNRLPDPRILMSFRKRASDDVGFVIVSLDKKGW